MGINCEGGREMEKFYVELDHDVSPFVKRVSCDTIGSVLPQLKQQKLDQHVSKISLTFRLQEPVHQDDWQLHIEPDFAPSFHWAPHLTPADTHIIDQHSF